MSFEHIIEHDWQDNNGVQPGNTSIIYANTTKLTYGGYEIPIVHQQSKPVTTHFDWTMLDYAKADVALTEAFYGASKKPETRAEARRRLRRPKEQHLDPMPRVWSSEITFNAMPTLSFAIPKP